jgi:putative transposase
MKYNPDIHHRRSVRLKGYDYSKKGLYFITICIQNYLCLFGNIKKGEMKLNNAGLMIKHQWQALIHRFDKIKLHEFIVMPNHFHGIVEFVGAPLVGVQNTVPSTSGQPQGIAPTVGDVVGVYKSLTTNDYIQNVKQNNWQRFNKKLWQRNYYEHIIRDEISYHQISEYIQTNPLKWGDDTYYAEN